MRIYLDHNATTPVHPQVVAAMLHALQQSPGNPSSPHREGAAARRLVDAARAQCARLINAQPGQIVFTGGATEANNSVLHAACAPPGPAHIVYTADAHPSVLETVAALQLRPRVSATAVGVSAEGRVQPDELAAAIRPETRVATLLLANNETGAVQNAAELNAAAKTRGAPVHWDATQALGKIPVDAARLGCAWLTASAHKLQGPKGVGMVFVRGREITPLLHGGPQEKRRRGGTENTAGIIGFGAAAELAAQELPQRALHMQKLHKQLWEGMCKSIPDLHQNGATETMLPNTLNAEFRGASGELLFEALDGEGVACASGAACASGSAEPSHVLLAMGRTPQQAGASLRFSLGPQNTADEISRVLSLLPALVARVRKAAA